MPRLKGVSFETAIIERYRRRESSVEEALIEMYLAGVSVRRVEDITEALWGSKVSPATISELNKKAYVHIEDWRNRPLQGGRIGIIYPPDGEPAGQRGNIKAHFCSPFTVGSMMVNTFPDAPPSQRIFPPCPVTMLSAIERPRP